MWKKIWNLCRRSRMHKLLELCDRNIPATVQLIIATGWNRKRLFSVNALSLDFYTSIKKYTFTSLLVLQILNIFCNVPVICFLFYICYAPILFRVTAANLLTRSSGRAFNCVNTRQCTALNKRSKHKFPFALNSLCASARKLFASLTSRIINRTISLSVKNSYTYRDMIAI